MQRRNDRSQLGWRTPHHHFFDWPFFVALAVIVIAIALVIYHPTWLGAPVGGRTTVRASQSK